MNVSSGVTPETANKASLDPLIKPGGREAPLDAPPRPEQRAHREVAGGEMGANRV